jgi:ankyrin repeat protein
MLCRRRNDLDIFEASAVGDSARVTALLRDLPHLVNSYSPDGFHPLGYACFFGHGELVDVLLAYGANLEAPARNAMEVRPIHSAVAHADPAVALLLSRRLLDAGASPNVTQQRGFTPLHEAALRGHVELVRLLVSHGSNPEVRNAQGKGAIDLARENGHSDVAELLLRAQTGK